MVGAFGLIVNKPMAEVPIAELARKVGVEEEPGPAAPPKLTIFYGGWRAGASTHLATATGAVHVPVSAYTAPPVRR